MERPSLKHRIENIKKRFVELHGDSGEPLRLFSAPGRVNLIGEHTDYNGGFVLPAAIDRSVLLASRLSKDGRFHLASLNSDLRKTFGRDEFGYREYHGWTNYPKAVLNALGSRGCGIKGMDMLYEGDIPLGGGLSSSAAIEVVTACCAAAVNGHDISGRELALLCQEAENRYIGMKCGIMDQFVISMGKKGYAMFIDCRSLGYENVPLPLEGVSIIVSNTKIKRKLVDSKYNERRMECEKGAGIIAENEKGVKQLRDVSADMFGKYCRAMPGKVRDRCRHVIEENGRVRKAVELLKGRRMEEFGKLMNESHASLRDLYEVSCPELDTMVEAAMKIKGTLGSRMTGAGFGGCTVSLVMDGDCNEFMERVGSEYRDKSGIEPEFYICSTGAGAGEAGNG